MPSTPFVHQASDHLGMEVPGCMKRLVRTVMRGFYSIEHVLVMDMLIRKSCLKEDDLETLLHFEKKQVRTITTQLKNDKMLKSKLKMETRPDGGISRQNYYYINYRAFVNVVKYKLDHMRRKIETEERDITSRASFVCTECRKTYTDLEANLLCDLSTGEFKCTYCNAVVEEDPNVLPKADSRQVLARFNDQIEPFYLLLKEVEDIVLPDDNDMCEFIKPDEGSNTASNPTTVKIKGEYDDDDSDSDDRFKRPRDVNFEADLTVRIENISNGSSHHGRQKERGSEHSSKSKKGKKEQPAWLMSSSIYDSNSSNISSTSTSKKEKETNNVHGSDQAATEREIAELLLLHEKRDDLSAVDGILGSSRLDPSYTNGVHKDVHMESEDEEMEPVIGVRIGGDQLIPLTCMGEGMVEIMSKDEKDRFVKLTQEIYSYLYD